MYAFVVLLLLSSTAARSQVAESVAPSPSRPGSAQNIPVAIDPTENVKALNEAATKRQDDLRLATEKLLSAQLGHVKEISELYFMRNRELREAAVVRLDSEARLRSEFYEKLAFAEAKRIDAIRLVDVGAAATLAQRTTEQATALATVVTQSAEVLRNQVSRAAEDTRALVATTAATALQNQQQQFQAITTRLAALEQAGAEGKGKQTVTDPALLALIQEVKNISAARGITAGVDAGRSDVVGWIAAGIMLLISIAGFSLAIVNRQSRKP